jgi:hypothetical protein
MTKYEVLSAGKGRSFLGSRSASSLRVFCAFAVEIITDYGLRITNYELRIGRAAAATYFAISAPLRLISQVKNKNPEQINCSGLLLHKAPVIAVLTMTLTVIPKCFRYLLTTSVA